MNFEEAVKYLYSLGHEVLAMKFRLETVLLLAGACDDPQRKFPAVHLAGTNGKGSTAAMTAGVLRAAGYRVGLYTSPHLVSITERIVVNQERQERQDRIAPGDFARLANVVRAAGERLVAEGRLELPPTFFEQITVIAFLYFAECDVDLAVLEVGMGGRLDATNICLPVVTAITPIGYDHQKYLGESLGQIAGEKAGIIKTGIPVVVAPQEEVALKAIASRASQLHAPMISVDEEIKSSRLFTIDAVNDSADLMQAGRYRVHYQTDRDRYDLKLCLRGKHQVTNALTVIHIIEQLIKAGWRISTTAIIDGLNDTEWAGRLEMIRTSSSTAPLLLDGAHNPAGAAALRDFLVEHFSSVPMTLIFGVMEDKALEEMASILFPLAQRVIVTKVKNPRAAEPQQIAEQGMKWQREISCVGDVASALSEAFKTTPESGLICVCGSLYLVGEVKQIESLISTEPGSR